MFGVTDRVLGVKGSFMIETARLILRPWRAADLPEFVRITNTPAVMEFLGGVQELSEFDATLTRVQACQAANGFCFWLVDLRADGSLLGYCGLKIATAGPLTGEIEVGWRLREDAWGRGYAREAASASLEWAWRNLDCARIVAFTVESNTRSWGLMERLGMRRRREWNFEHPALPPGHPLRPHITYTIDRPSDG
jgi:RimJ/RimL family protein N-acetyltransferase